MSRNRFRGPGEGGLDIGEGGNGGERVTFITGGGNGGSWFVGLFKESMTTSP